MFNLNTLEYCLKIVEELTLDSILISRKMNNFCI